jgi:hypothetical protein
MGGGLCAFSAYRDLAGLILLILLIRLVRTFLQRSLEVSGTSAEIRTYIGQGEAYSAYSAFSAHLFGMTGRSGRKPHLKKPTAILYVPFHRIPPPKESMKAFLENRRLK